MGLYYTLNYKKSAAGIPLLIFALALLLVPTSQADDDDEYQGAEASRPATGRMVTKFKNWFGGGTRTTVDGGVAETSQSYNGPKAKVIIARIQDKTGQGWYNNNLGNAMADQLATALVNSGRFVVMERQNFGALIEEMNLGESGLARAGTTPKFGRIQGADLGIVAAVTAIQGNTSGTAGGFGGGKAGVIAGVLGSIRRGYIAMEFRIIDLESSQVLAATTVEGSSTDVNIAGLAGTLVGSAALGGALASWNNTPQGKALRVVIHEAVNSIAKKTPRQYFRYGGNRTPSRIVNKRVQSIQIALNDLGYKAGPADGIMGAKTTQAISGFQSNNNLVVTGTLDIATMQALLAKPKKVVASASKKIENIQRLLATLGYDVGTINGVLSKQTRKALGKFQLRSGLKATGNLDMDTLNELKKTSDVLNSFSSRAK